MKPIFWAEDFSNILVGTISNPKKNLLTGLPNL